MERVWGRGGDGSAVLVLVDIRADRERQLPMPTCVSMKLALFPRDREPVGSAFVVLSRKATTEPAEPEVVRLGRDGAC